MNLLAAWALYPLALGVVALGLALLVERVAGWRLPGALLLPVGLGTVIAFSRLITEASALAPLALPVLVVLALVGLALGRARLRTARFDRPLALAALGVLGVFGAPVILSGEPTFAGYTLLPDTSHQLTLAWLYGQQGPDWQSLADGTTALSAQTYLASGYPVGGQVALGVTAPLGIIDLAWLYQPFLTVLAVAGALAIAALIEPWVRGPRIRALMAFVAIQSSLVVGFALQGSIKELTAMAMLLTTVAALARLLHERRPVRSLVAVVVPGAAMVVALGVPALAYLAPLALVAVTAALVRAARARRAAELAWLGVAAVLAAVLTLPVLLDLSTALRAQTGVLDNAAAGGGQSAPVLGHLARPLDTAQTLGIWLEGDFRRLPESLRLQQVVSALTAIAVAVGGLWMLRRRAWGPLLLTIPLGLLSLYLLSRGNAYANSKVLMIASPAVLLLALLGAYALREGGRRLRVAGTIALTALTAGVVSSSALAYHDVSLAPYDRYAELLEINDRLAGRGPVIFNEYDEFSEYFLRSGPVWSQPEWPHGYRNKPYAPNALIDTYRRPSLKTPLDPDDLALDYVMKARYMVLRRSPVTSRPPSAFVPVWQGEHYTIWKNTGRPIARHKVLGREVLDPAAKASCEGLERLVARSEARGGRLAFVKRPLGPVIPLTGLNVSRAWGPYVNYPGALTFTGPGEATGSFELKERQRFRLWLEGSVSRAIKVEIDDRPVGRIENSINNPGAFLPVGEVVLQPGRHTLRLSMGGGGVAPGDAGYDLGLRQVGPLVFSPPENAARTVQTVPVEKWRSLCGQRLDWVEVLPR